MANIEGCVDPIYTTPLTPQPLPNPDDCSCEGGGGDGHKYTFTSTATGWQVREDGKLIYSYTDKDTNTTYTWQATEEGWLVKDNTGKVIFTYTDKKNKDTTYSFEKKDDCGFKVTDSDGKVVFDYDNDCAGTTYTYEQTGVDFKVTDNKTGQVVFTYKGMVDTNTTYTWEDYKDGFKVTDSEGVVAYIYDPNLGKDSDGSYAIDTLLSTVFKGNTTISTGQITGFDPANLVVGETLVYDGVGSVGVITKDNGDGTYQVTTMTISPGTRQGVRLGSVETAADLPATCADAEALGWQTPQLGDFAYVIEGDGTADDVISEYLVTSDTDCNLTWTFSHSFNAGQYQEQSSLSMSGMILTGGAVQGTFGTPIDPKTLIRGVMRNGILLTPDAQGKVNVIVDDSHIIVNALPTTNIVDKAEYIVIDANQKVTGTWVHDNTGWYQTYAAVTQVKAHQVVTALPTTGIEENVEYVVVDNANKVTGTWVYDPTKGWLQTEVLDKPAHIVVKDLPTTDIDDEAEYVQVSDLTDPVNTFVASWVHTDSGWIKTGENVKASAAHIVVTALPTTNINENAEYLVMTDTSDPNTLTGTWVRVNGNWVQTERKENGYHIVTALPTTDIDEDNTYIVVTDIAKPDDTFQGQYAYDKATNKWINLASDKTVYYNVNRDGQELKSADAVIAGADRFTSISGGQRIPFVNRPNSTIDQAGDGTWIVPPHSKVEVIMSLALYNAVGGSEPNGEWCVREVGYTGTDRHDPRYILGVDPYDHRSSANNAPGWSLNRTASGHYTNTTDNPVTIEAVCLSIAIAGTQIYNATSHITVQEIGRVVDPVAYMLNDGNAQEMPVGSLIQTMSNSAPKHYLICDGSEYAIGTYPELEAHFVKEFGAVNHFGGASGKWKVPDLRGEFLRGTGANITTGYEGEDVGDHQEGSTLVGMYASSDNGAIYTGFKNVAAVSTFDKSAPNTGRTAVNYETATENNTYNSVIGTGRARPTNTSVKYCIKYETVPKVVIEAAAYNCSIAASYPAVSGVLAGVDWVFDHSDIVGNASMVNGNTFVAPIDGMYSVGPQFTTRGEGNIAVCMLINGVNHNWNQGMYSSSLLHLKAGDTVGFKTISYKNIPASANSGRVNIALVQVADEKRTAELMLKPNLWTPGVEQNFGDGVYGMRWTGTYTKTGSGRQDFTLSTADTANITLIQVGGNQKRLGYSFCPSTYLDGNQNNCLVFYPTTKEWRFITTDAAQTNKYDVWAIYTKD